MNNYYTYAYLREDGTPYYIGKEKGFRLYANHRREKKNCIAVPIDKSRIIYLKQNLTEKEAFKHEVYMISVLGRKDNGTGILRNRTDGGEGASGAIRSDNFKKNLSEYHSGKKLSEKTKIKIGKANSIAKENERGKFRITFSDGKKITIVGIKRWMKENNYNYTCISRLRNGEYKKHKDIVAVEKLDKTS
jgi:hypothetical protein